MSDTQAGQVTTDAAEIYDEFFVPALFAEWAPRLCDAAAVGEGHRVLDVGCGTGVAARAAAARVGPGGHVAGVDINPGMLAVAARADGSIEWHRAAAEDLPFDDGSFDVVLSQFALMFVEDRRAAVGEMRRVTSTGGTVAVAIWDRIERAPGYHAMAGLLERLFGADVASSLLAPYQPGDPTPLVEDFAACDLRAQVTTSVGRARFPSIDAWVHTDVRGWTLADVLDDDQYELLRHSAADELQEFVGADGTVEFDHPAHIVTATI